MRVLLITPPTEKPGGVANYYRTLRGYLPADVEYFVIGAQTDSEGPWRIIIRSLKDYVGYYRKLKGGSYDLVHLNPSLAPKAIVRDGIFLLIAKALRIRVIVFMRGWLPGCERFIRKYFLYIFRYVYQKADAFIVLGAEFRDKLIEMCGAKEVYLETTVVDDEVFSRSADMQRKHARDGDGAELNILTLTRIEKTKGVYKSIDAYRKLKGKFPRITLTIAGDGPELPAIKQYVYDLMIQDVSFPGFVSGELKHTTYEHADIYLFPTSYGEGMPNAVLEAMAYGKPVVTRPVGGIRDYFENGCMGFITESLDPNVFAELLETLIIDRALRQRIGAFNRDYARERFMASNVAGRLQKIYREVLRNATDC